MTYNAIVRKHSNNWDILLTLFFLYMLDPFFIDKVVTFHRAFYYGVAIIPIVLFFVFRNRITIDRNLRYILMLYAIYFIAVFIISVFLSGKYDYLIELVKLIFKILNNISLFLVWKYAKEKNKVSKGFESFFVNAVVFYVISSVFFILLPDLKSFWIDFIYNDRQPLYIILSKEYGTRYGLAGWSSFGEAYMILFALVFLLDMYIKSEVTKLDFISKLAFLLLGSFFYGRFALVVMIIIILLFSLYTLIKSEWWIIRTITIIGTVSIVLLVVLYNYNDDTNAILRWALEPVINFFERGEFTSSSTLDLSRMYRRFNPTLQEILVGTGQWYEPNGMPYKYTDVGFMRNIYFGGIIVSMVLYIADILLVLYYMKLVLKKTKQIDAWFMGIALLVILVLADLKGSMAITFIRYIFPLILAKKYYLSRESIEREMLNEA